MKHLKNNCSAHDLIIADCGLSCANCGMCKCGHIHNNKVDLTKELAELSSMELSGRMEATPEEKHQAAKFLGKLGGISSAKKRLEKIQSNRNKLSKKQKNKFNKSANGALKSLNYTTSAS